MRLSALGLCAALGLAFAPTGAQAFPISPLSGEAIDGSILLVRDGCGRGMRFSERRGRCVEDFDAPPPRRSGYYDERRPQRFYEDDAPPPPRRRNSDNDAAIAAGVLGAAVLGGLAISQSRRNKARPVVVDKRRPIPDNRRPRRY